MPCSMAIMFVSLVNLHYVVLVYLCACMPGGVMGSAQGVTMDVCN